MAADQGVALWDVQDLVAIGAPLPFRVLDALGRLLLSQGQVVANAAQLESLLARGAWVEYDAVAKFRVARDLTKALPAAAPPPRSNSLFDRWQQHIWELDALFRKMAKRLPLAQELEAFSSQFITLVDRDVDVALYMAVRQDDRRFALYALTHGLHAATLAILTGRQLGWDVQQVLCVTRAALTMNVCMLELQATMAEQGTPPTPRQIEQIRSHPEGSAQMLRDCGVNDEDWLNTVLDHHEQPGGGGYPRGLTEVSDRVRVLRAADVFSAKITPRALRSPLTPQQAARDLFQLEAGSGVANALIKSVGVHPPGELVQLQNGEIALVTRRAAKGPNPLVSSIGNRNGQPTVGTVARDTAQPEFAIVGPCMERAKFLRVPPERVYGLITV